MAVLRLFASAREAAGTGRAEFDGETVGAVLAAAVAAYGSTFERILANCRLWVNGEGADELTAVIRGDEVAVLPPVSGGSR